MPNQLNVLVEDPCHALIADFGLAKISRKMDPDRHTSYQNAFSVRWAAPEVVSGGKYSEEADIYSFAMVVIEVGRGRSIVCRHSAYRYYRCLLERPRSVLQHRRMTAHHGRHTRPLQMVCGNW